MALELPPLRVAPRGPPPSAPPPQSAPQPEEPAQPQDPPAKAPAQPAAAEPEKRDTIRAGRSVLPSTLDREVQTKDKLGRASVPPWRVSPDSPNKRRWEWLLVAFVMYNAYSIPFGLSIKADPSLGVRVFEYCVDALFVADLALNFLTGVEDEWGDVCYELPVIARHYSRHWLIVDLPATIPFEVLALLVGKGSNIEMIALLKCPRLLRIGRLMRKLDQFAAARAVRIVNLLIGFCIVAHWMGCGFYFMGTEYGDPELDPHWIDGVIDSERDSVASTYLRALYFSFTTLSTVGYGDITAVTQDEYTFVAFMLIIGAVVSATVLANVTSLIEKFDKTHTQYMSKVSSINEFFELHRLPRGLQERVVDYLDALWTIKGGVEFEDVAAGLPGFLQVEISMGRCAKLLQDVPLFKNTGVAFIRAVVMKLHAEVCLSGDMVCYAGDCASSMYLLYKGRVQIQAAHSEEPITLSEGAFFGEAACLDRGKRTHNVRALSFCYLYTLSATHFADIIADFPEYKEAIVRMARARMAVAGYKTAIMSNLLRKNRLNQNLADRMQQSLGQIMSQAYDCSELLLDLAARTLQTFWRHYAPSQRAAAAASVQATVAFALQMSTLKKRRRKADGGGNAHATVLRVAPADRAPTRLRLSKARVHEQLQALEANDEQLQEAVRSVFTRVDRINDMLVAAMAPGSRTASGRVVRTSKTAAPSWMSTVAPLGGRVAPEN